MADQSKSLLWQYDLFVDSTLKYLDTATEKDYIQKLKVIDQLTHRVNESEADKGIIKKNLKAHQDECSKLNLKLKTSACLLDKALQEKEKLLFEKETMKFQIDQLHSVLKKPDAAEKSHKSLLNRSDCTQLDEQNTFDNTSALLSDLSYSQSDVSCEHLMKNPTLPNPAPINKGSTENFSNKMKTKKCAIRNMNTNDEQIIATTTLTMDLDDVNNKSIIKTYPTQTSRIALISASSESLFTSESEDFVPKSSNHLSTNIQKLNKEEKNNKTEKEHCFIQKIIVIPEICCHCFKKVKFNNYMVKCLDCKIIAHLECKEYIPAICIQDQLKINALNCGVPPLIVQCICEIERRGLDTAGLYTVSGSSEEVNNLRDKFCNGVPNLNGIDIHVLCSCLKDLICMQKNCLIPESDFSKLADALKTKNDVSKSLCRGVLELPTTNRNTLAFLILHLQKVASSSKCNVDFNIISVVFGPTIVGITSTSFDNLLIKSKIIFKVLLELLKLSNIFWLSALKTDSISSDEQLVAVSQHITSTENQSRTPVSSNGFISSGQKRRILDCPKKNKIAKQLKIENKN